MSVCVGGGGGGLHLCVCKEKADQHQHLALNHSIRCAHSFHPRNLLCIRVDAAQESAREVARLKAEFKARVEPKKAKVPIKLEEIPTIVIDLGSDTIKAGFAGEDVRGTRQPPAASHFTATFN
jgi:hypothetical protein